MFNIETYLDSLPEDTEEINVSDKSIKNLVVTRFKNLKKLSCSNNRLTSLLLSKNLEILVCDNNQLTSLDLNKNLKELICSYNQLTSLHLNENLQRLDCSNNQMTSLRLNEKLEILYSSNNQLTSLHLNEKLEKLYSSNNQLTSLHLNENLKILHCGNNQLTSLRLNEKIEILHCQFNKLTILPIFDEKLIICFYYRNPICEIINPYDKIINCKQINQKLRLLNQFRYLYYCLKFKKRFRDLLWVKIREPKIRERYSHHYLVEHLHEDTDLDDLLDNW